MDALSKFAEHTHKLFGSSIKLALQGHRVLEGHTVEISAEGLKAVFPENLLPHLDGMVKFTIPAKPAGAHPIVAHIRTIYSVFNSTKGGFLVEMKFTGIPQESVKLLRGFLEG